MKEGGEGRERDFIITTYAAGNANTAYVRATIRAAVFERRKEKGRKGATCRESGEKEIARRRASPTLDAPFNYATESYLRCSRRA